MNKVKTDLPFKITETSIIIIKGLPVLQCDDCREYVIENSVMERVDGILDKADKAAELAIISFCRLSSSAHASALLGSLVRSGGQLTIGEIKIDT